MGHYRQVARLMICGWTGLWLYLLHSWFYPLKNSAKWAYPPNFAEMNAFIWRIGGYLLLLDCSLR